MRFLILFVLLIAAVRADLTCLAWGFLLTPLGLFCHFKHDTFNAVENATVNAVEKIAEDVKDAVEFKIEHHPLVLGYEWVDTAVHNGTGAANHRLEGQIQQEIRVDIGFGKEIANTAVQIYELVSWNDLVICLMTNTYMAVNQSLYGDSKESQQSNSSNTTNLEYTTPLLTPLALPTPTGGNSNGQALSYGIGASPSGVSTEKKRRAVGLGPSLEIGKGIVAKCANEKFNRIAKPQVFNITNPDEKIGSTLAQLATFFVPIGGEEEAGAKLVTNFDLAIPGAEDAGRIYQKVEGQAQHFASEENALAVKENLDDSSWVDSNCDSCTPPAGATTGKRSNRARDQTRARLGIRGGSLSVCCGLPEVIKDLFGAYDVPDPNGEGQELIQQPLPYWDPTTFEGARFIPEEILQPPPQLTTWADAATDSAKILEDLQQEQTAALAWSSQATDVFHSDDLFKLLRRAFTPVDDQSKALARELSIGLMNPKRTTFNIMKAATEWPSRSDEVARIKKFTGTAIQQGIDTVAALKGLSADEVALLDGSVDYYWIPPHGDALTRNPDFRGLHVDGNILQFGAADQPGLVIRNAASATGDKVFRVPILDDGWHLIKCLDWEPGVRALTRKAATEHTVFGPEIVANGRVSIIVNIFKAYS